MMTQIYFMGYCKECDFYQYKLPCVCCNDNGKFNRLLIRKHRQLLSAETYINAFY